MRSSGPGCRPGSFAERVLGPGGLDGLLAHVRQGTVAAAVQEQLGNAVGDALHGADRAGGEAVGHEEQGPLVEGPAGGRVGGPVDFGDAPRGLLAGGLAGVEGLSLIHI